MSNPWSGIEKPASEFNVRLVAEHHPLRLYWGVDSRGRYLFVVDVLEPAMPVRVILPDLEGIRIATAVQGGRGKIVLLLNETPNWELFHALCNDLVRASAGANDEIAAVAVVVRRLQRWQDFLRRARSPILPLEEIKGLLGELLFLLNPVATRFGWDAAIGFWKGPEDAPQDFAIHDTAVEVKCQSGSSKPSVRITSVDQLNPQLPHGFLVVQTLATAETDAEGAFTLNSLTDRIRTGLGDASPAARERFEGLLFSAGYIHHEYYDGLVFQRVATSCYRIVEGFPRLRPGDIPPGIQRVTYQLELEACAPFAAPLEFGPP
ncbi:MAG: PD-(D/E)XK motif protein [Bryobacteraceae bacterium]|nr:PD-(D/E)XK motif protein [Bryobacteraceae bacterium]